MALSDQLMATQLAASNQMRDNLFDQAMRQSMHNPLSNGLLDGIAGGPPYGGITADDYRRRSQIDMEAIGQQYERHKVMMDKETRMRERAIEFCNRHYRPHSDEWELMLAMCMDPRNEGMDIVSMVHEHLRKQKHNIDEVSTLEYLKTKNDEFTADVKLKEDESRNDVRYINLYGYPSRVHTIYGVTA